MAERRSTAAAKAAAPDPTEPAAPTWWRFIGPYPVVLMDRGLEVDADADSVAGPVPDDVNWVPSAAPTTAEES